MEEVIFYRSEILNFIILITDISFKVIYLAHTQL